MLMVMRPSAWPVRICSSGDAGFEIEDEGIFGTDVFGGVFQVELIELDEEPALGELELGPAFAVAFDGEVGDEVVEAAGFAEAFFFGEGRCNEHAVTDLFVGVVAAFDDRGSAFRIATTIGCGRGGRRLSVCVALLLSLRWRRGRCRRGGSGFDRLQRCDGVAVLAPADFTSAVDADGVVEEEAVAAGALIRVHG